MYSRAINNQGWSGDVSDNGLNDWPLTHTILERLGALETEEHDGNGGLKNDACMLDWDTLDTLFQSELYSSAMFVKALRMRAGFSSPRIPTNVIQF